MIHETEKSFDQQLAEEAVRMNNFIAYLHGGLYRRLAADQVQPGQTYGEYLPESEHKWRSEIFLSQTPNQFFALVDELITQFGIQTEEIDLSGADWKKKLQIKKLVAPVFIALRKMGYTDYELNV